MTRQGNRLLRRYERNPILNAQVWPYPVHTVFNPGATKLEDGRTLLLCRCEDWRGFSHLCKAISVNGIDGWQIDDHPTFSPDPDNYPTEVWGVEDPRITFVPEDQHYVISYTAFGRGGPGVAIATTKDFVEFERHGLVMQPDDKDAALLPRKFKGEYALIHRPVSELGAHIWLSYSPNLRSWGGHRTILRARRGGWWDANKIGLSPPLIETSEGWLMMYHGVRAHASGSLYRVGLALFDKEDPEVCLLRGESWIMGPEADYERFGDVGYVVFPGGVTIDDDGDGVNVYYGAADSCIALAKGSIGEMLEWLKENDSIHDNTGDENRPT